MKQSFEHYQIQPSATKGEGGGRGGKFWSFCDNVMIEFPLIAWLTNNYIIVQYYCSIIILPNTITTLFNFSRSKGKQTMKFGQLMEYDKTNIFLQK